MSSTSALITPFITASEDVFKRMTGCEVERGTPSMKKGLVPGHSVSVMVGLVGDLRGSFVISMTDSVARMVATRMKFDKKQSDARDLDRMEKSAISELANVIAGNATIALSNDGYRLYITPPTIIQGTNQTVEIVSIQTVVVPLVTSAGEVELNIALMQLAKYRKD